MAEVRGVPYADPHTTAPAPTFCVRGWDDGRVFTDVRCPCGREVFDDAVALSDVGQISLPCPACGRRFIVRVVCAMLEPDAGDPIDQSGNPELPTAGS